MIFTQNINVFTSLCLIFVIYEGFPDFAAPCAYRQIKRYVARCKIISLDKRVLPMVACTGLHVTLTVTEARAI